MPSIELGAAWAKTSKAGKPYLSVKLDGPTLVAPINCALTKQANGPFALVWNRKDAKADERDRRTGRSLRAGRPRWPQGWRGFSISPRRVSPRRETPSVIFPPLAIR